MSKILCKFLKIGVFQNAYHYIVLCTKQAARLACRMMMVYCKPTFIWAQAAYRASEVLGRKRGLVPLWSYAVVPLEFFAPLNGSSFIRALMTPYRCASSLCLAILSHVRGFLDAQFGVLFWGSHNRNSITSTYGCQAITP